MGKKARSILCIARVETIDDDGYEGVILRKVPSHTNFDQPTFIVDEMDCGTFFSKEDIVKKLPPPEFLKGSQRKSKQLVFKIDLSVGVANLDIKTGT